MKCLGAGVFLVFAVWLPAEEPLLRIPPVRAAVEIEGQTVSLTASGAVWNGEGADRYRLSLTVDLSDLQSHVFEIVRAHLDRTEPCGERMRILGATLAPGASGAMLTAQMHYERWGCAKVLGKTVNKRLAGGDGSIGVELTPAIDGTEARLNAEVREIQADGTLGELLRSGPLGAGVKEKVRKSVQSALDKATEFRAMLPEGLRDVVRLKSIGFAEGGGGHLGLAVEAEAAVSGAQLQELRSGRSAGSSKNP
jgi:hypothetical protein